MRILIAIIVSVVLSGCAHQPPPPNGKLGAAVQRSKHVAKPATRIVEAPLKTTAEGRQSWRHYHHRRHWGFRRHWHARHRWSDPTDQLPPHSEVTRLPPNVKALQPVFFATNRKVTDTSVLKVASFTSDRSNKTIFGRAIVSVPEEHVIGSVERPKFVWYKLSVEAETDKDHFRIRELARLSRDDFAAGLKNDADSALVFVHGYNVPFDDAIYKSAQIAYDSGFTGTVAAFSWPSRGKLLSYDYDEKSAEYSTGALFDLLKLVRFEAKVKNIYVVAHSLGSRIVADALQQAALSKTPLDITELVFAAPDVDKDVFSSKAEHIKAVAGKVTIYASAVDRALMASGKKAGGISRMGFVSATGPNLIDGIEMIDVTAVGDDMFGLNHSTFSGARAVLDDIGRIILDHKHPPNLRSPTLEMLPNKTSPLYWRYPK